MLNANIPLGVQPIQIEPRMNALMRAQQMQGMQQQNALRDAQMQQIKQAAEAAIIERQRQEAQRARVEAYLSQVRQGRPVNPVEALQETGSEDLVKFLVNAPNLGRPKVARTMEIAGPDGRPMTVQLDEFGGRVGDAAPKPVERKVMELGGTKQVYDPFALTPGQSFSVTMTPGEKDASARGWAGVRLTERGQNMADQRAREQAGAPIFSAELGGFVDPKTRAFTPALGADGKPPVRKQGQMSSTLQKELLEADDTAQAARAVLGTIQAAKQINDKAYSGIGAKTRAQIVSNTIPTAAADATIDIDNMMTGQALESLKLVFGGMPTEGERKILLEMQASVDKTPAQRKAILDRAQAAAERRMKYATAKAAAIRDGSYLASGVQMPEAAPDQPPSGPVRVNSIEEAMKLKPGTRFIDPDGVERVR